jgi:hypothetical protein
MPFLAVLTVFILPLMLLLEAHVVCVVLVARALLSLLVPEVLAVYV